MGVWMASSQRLFPRARCHLDMTEGTHVRVNAGARTESGTRTHARQVPSFPQPMRPSLLLSAAMNVPDKPIRICVWLRVRTRIVPHTSASDAHISQRYRKQDMVRDPTAAQHRHATDTPNAACAMCVPLPDRPKRENLPGHLYRRRCPRRRPSGRRRRPARSAPPRCRMSPLAAASGSIRKATSRASKCGRRPGRPCKCRR